MNKTLLAAGIAAVLAGGMILLRAGDMGNMPGMNMGSMETNSLMENTNADSTVQSYQARGIVEKIAPDLHQATIHHENIPGYMDEMTMDFTVQNTNELNGIAPGDQITFKLVVGKNDEWIEDIKRTGQTTPVMTNSMPSMDMSETNK